ncbi:MAG: M23 family metallopeptidase [Chloroflexota bacterium]|nr:M23 family metallopeptidase [Chloroflexota bacterium]
MKALASRMAGAVVLLLILAGPGAGSLLATDDYTLPFSDPGVVLSYGVDRDRALNRQLDWTGHTWMDGVPHPGRVYDQHSGVDYPMALRSEVAAAKDGTVIDVEGGFATSQFGNFGNFVLLQHADGRQTLYYHLASAPDGGIGVAVGDTVVAGQPIGRSGCSGICYGAHLHFEMLVWSSAAKDFVPVDPLAERRWTTWPGRIPFEASYVRESNAGTEVIRPGQTITHWVEFRNTGGRTWRNNSTPGRIALGTWGPASHASPFRASDWPSSWMATYLDTASVPPDGVGRFTFGLRGSPALGSYRETFNLLAQSVHWFDHARLGGFYVPIVVSNLPSCGPGGSVGMRPALVPVC